MKTKLRNALLMGLSLVLVAVLAIGGTLAYLTDTDSAVNVMTVGNVKIVQNEQQRDGNGGLEDFEQGKVMLPVTNPDDPINWPKGENVDGITLPTVDNFVDKIVTVDNVGSQNAYVRVLIAFPAEMDDDTSAENMMMRWIYDVNEASGTWTRTGGTEKITLDGKFYNVYNCTYNAVLAPDATTASPAITGIFINSKVDATIDEDGAITYFMGNKSATYPAGEGPKLYVLSQGVQAAGFNDANTALDTAFGEVTATNAANWFGGMEGPTLVSDADGLKAALANGGEVALAKDISVDANTAITVASGNTVTLDLNGHTLSATANKNGDQELFLVKGNMTVENGTIELTAENNQGWSAMATIFDVTAGGVLNMNDVTANVSGTDMNFIVHLNNWGNPTEADVSLNADNCVFNATYCAVRVGNGGPGMNNVKITNSTLTGKTRAFWVHNYTSADFEGKLYHDATQAYDEAQVLARLNLDIYNNGNTFTTTDDPVTSPILYGFNNPVYYDLNGNVIAN